MRLPSATVTPRFARCGTPEFSAVESAASGHLAACRWAMLGMAADEGRIRVVLDHIEREQMRRVLVVTDRSRLPQWKQDIATWTGRHAADGVSVVHEAVGLDKARNAELAWSCDRTLVVANYAQMLCRAPHDASPFFFWARTKKWDMVVADESHSIRGASTQSAYGLYAIGRRAESRIAMTGTPVVSGPQDLWSQYRFVDESLLGHSYSVFLREYAIRTERAILAWRRLDMLAERIRAATFSTSAA